MPVELDDKLRDKLVDLLDQVPSLEDRGARDAWLKCLPKNAQDQITSRHDNRKIDLKFIISASQTLRLGHDRWAILILLDDVVKGLVGITLSADITRVREEVAGALESLPDEQRVSAPDSTQAEPTPSGNPKRQEWIKRLGFKRDPFLYKEGEKDPYLQEYFYFDMQNFSNISGDVSSWGKVDVSQSGTVFVFGRAGSGKSTLRNVISQRCRNYDILPVVYQDMGPLASMVERGERVHVKDHVRLMLELARRALLDEREKSDKRDTAPAQTERNKIIRDQLGVHVSQHEMDPVRQHALKDLLRPDPNVVDKWPDDPRELLGRFCRYVTELFGYQFVYILVDPNDDIAPTPDTAWQVLEPLLRAQRLLDLSQDKVVFKLFLREEFQARALQIPWIEEEQTRRVYRLEWPPEELRTLLRERLWQSSKSRYESLGQLSDASDLDARVISLSPGNPRQLIVLASKLFDEHCRHWSPEHGEPLLITSQEAHDVLSPYIAAYQKTPNEQRLGQLLEQGETGKLEFKSTMRYNLKASRPDKEMEKEVAKAVGAFMNTEGGTLIIGVDDNQAVLGLEDDFSTLGKGQKEDAFVRAFVDITDNLFSPAISPDYYKAEFLQYQDKRVYVVQVQKSEKPVYCLFDGKKEFWVRKLNRKRKLEADELVDYVMSHFSRSPGVQS